MGRREGEGKAPDRAGAASQVVVSRETWAEWLSRMTSMAMSAGSAVLRSLRNSMNSRLRWRSLTRAWT